MAEKGSRAIRASDIPSLEMAARDIDNTKFIKALLTSLLQMEDLFPSLEKRGKGRFCILIATLLWKLTASGCLSPKWDAE